MTTLPNASSSITNSHKKAVPAGYVVRDELSSTICEIFAAEARGRSQAVAVVFEGQQLSYADLDRRSSQLAHYLIMLGVRPGARVGICIERSLELIVGLLGILKAGAAYVPFDPHYPRERLAFMLQDAEVEALLVQEKLATAPHLSSAQLVVMDREWSTVEKQPAHLPPVEIGSDNLAYIVYTSGSTGTPKGVCICHRSVVRLVRNTQYAHFGPDETFLHFAPISFDAATFEIWGALLNGARLMVFPPYPPSVKELGEWLSHNAVTTAWLTAGLFHQLAESDPGHYFRNIRQLLAGGDVLSPHAVRNVLKQYPNCRLVNGYGPTENTTFSTCGQASEMDATAATVPIGRPIANSTAYILDEQMRPVPEGEPGELFLGGAGLAQGYWKRPELTAEKFIPNPLSGVPGDRLYRSGDMARFLPGGIGEFIGRIDQQVKIRGFRIELGEIEAALKQHPEVGQTVVQAIGEGVGGKRLVAYITRKSGDHLSISGMRDYLGSKLPEYMIPSVFMMLEEMPLTANGKVDRKALPRVTGLRPEMEQPYVAPRTSLERTLCDIWSEVLQVEQVGVDDSFFHLGGHSLLGTQICSRLQNAYGRQLTLRNVYLHSSVADMARFLESSAASIVPKYPPIVAAARPQDVPLGASQERIWFLQQLDRANTAYYFQATLDIKGPLDVEALAKSLREVVHRHEIFRTSFMEKDGKPIQVIHEAGDVLLPVISLEQVEEGRQPGSIVEWTQKEVDKGFDVRRIPLVRWVLFRLAADCHVLLHLEHHMIHDGWSFNVFLGELFKAYMAFSAGKPSPLPPVPIQFADFALWQRDFLASAQVQSQMAYWEKQLGGSSLVTELSTDRPRPQMQTFNGAVRRVSLPLQVARAARVFSNQQHVSLFVTMMAAFIALTYRYTHQNDLCIGSSVANRQHPDTENLLGMLVNNVVFRMQASGDATFQELLSQIHTLAVEASDNQDVPYHAVIQRLKLERNPSINPGFQLMFNFHNSPVTVPELPKMKLELAEGLGNGGAKFDIGVIAIPSSERRLRLNHEWVKDEIVMLWEYNTDLFDESTVIRMMGHYERLLENATAAPAKQVGMLGLLSPQEREQLIIECNRTQAEYPRERAVTQLFEEQVARAPNAIAVEFEGQQLNYLQLNQRADCLAHYLMKLGAGPESLVGICVERGLEMIVSLLGTLKAGAAYVPLDPTYPAERIAYILEDAQVDFLLTKEVLRSALPPFSRAMVLLDQHWELISRENTDNPAPRMLPSNLAYVIYTSGSTGKPKGVQITHQALVNALVSLSVSPQLRSEDILLAVTTLCFDVAGVELFLPLIQGARMRILSRESSIDGMQLLREVNNGVTVLQATPTSWLLLLEAGWRSSPGLKALCGGEALSPELARKIASRCHSAWNMYGPTETTIWSLIEDLQDLSDRVAIGRPIANTQVYVLDEQMEPVPVGIIGELYIGGDGLARGYLRRSDLTAERFVPNPFSPTGERLYRTGDWARYMADGKLECLGRMDYQVKIRGYRIELGEIESALLEYPAVDRAVVTVGDHPRKDKELVAYVVYGKDQTASIGDLQTFLMAKLPRHMVPSHFVVLAAMPLTSNGKIDRKALPVTGIEQSGSERKYVPPRTPLEKALAEIWAEVLHVERVGVEDDFFQLGGHSLLGTQLISRIRKAYQIELPLRRIFEGPNIGRLAVAVEEAVIERIDMLAEAEVQQMLEAGQPSSRTSA